MLPILPPAAASRLDPERVRAVNSFYGALAGGNFEQLDAVLTPDWDDVPLAPGQEPGPQGIKPIFSMLRTAFPDMRVEIVDALSDGDRLACRVRVEGRHSGPLFGVPASGHPVSFALHEFHEFEGSRIRRTFHMEDLFGLFSQIGRWPQAASEGK